jgi:hypothetical protein
MHPIRVDHPNDERFREQALEALARCDQLVEHDHRELYLGTLGRVSLEHDEAQAIVHVSWWPTGRHGVRFAFWMNWSSISQLVTERRSACAPLTVREWEAGS